MKKVKEAVGTHVGRAMEIRYSADELEADEKESIELAKKNGGTVIEMNTIIDKYLYFLHEATDNEIISEVPAGITNPALRAAAAGGGGVVGKVAGAAAGMSPVTYALYGLPYALKLANFAWKNTFNKAHKTCRGLEKDDYTSCIRKFKLQAYNQQVAAMKKGLPTCNKSKTPDKCKQKIQDKIQKLQWKVKTLRDAVSREKKAQLAKAKAAGQAMAQQQAAQQ